MTVISVDQSTILAKCSGPSFAKTVFLLKNLKCIYSSENQSWIIPHRAYDRIIEQVEELDDVVCSQDTLIAIKQLNTTPSELIINKERLLFKKDLMKKDPLKGKFPNENFQEDDIKKAILRNRFGVFHEQGLGKSYIMSAILTHLRYYEKSFKALILTSAIGVYNIKHELLKFTYLTEAEILIADKDNRLPFDNIDATVVLCSYNTFRLVIAAYLKKHKITAKKPRNLPFNLHTWLRGSEGMLMLDESHNIGNPTALQSYFLHLISPNFKYRYLYSGTPADTPEKLYSIYKMIDPWLVDNLIYNEWLQEYAILGTKWSAYGIAGWNYKKLEELHKKAAPYISRRLVVDHIDLPENYIKKIYIPFKSIHFSIYKEFVIDTLDEIKKEKGFLFAEDVENEFQRLLLSVDNPSLLANQDLPKSVKSKVEAFNFEKHHSKVDVIRDIIEEEIDENKEKGILWITHPISALSYMKIFSSYNPYLIIGETPKRGEEKEGELSREDIIEEFKADKKRHLLIANISVLNTSVTITEASWQVYAELCYNFTQFDQSMKRIYRNGQKKRVKTYLPLINHSLDIMRMKRLKDKESLSIKMTSKQFLTKDEWSQIFQMSEDN